jgi:hypothetical protein
VVAQHFQTDQKISARKLMKVIGTSRMTAARLLEDPAFLQEIEFRRELIAGKGLMRSFRKVAEKRNRGKPTARTKKPSPLP